MLSRIVLAVVAAVIVYLLCVFVGGVLLVSLGIPIAVAIGKFLEQYASVFSILAFLWYFFAGRFKFPARPA
jgi:hypothetical protein